MEVIKSILSKAEYLLQFPKVSITDVIEIAIIAFLVYEIMLFVKIK